MIISTTFWFNLFSKSSNGHLFFFFFGRLELFEDGHTAIKRLLSFGHARHVGFFVHQQQEIIKLRLG